MATYGEGSEDSLADPLGPQSNAVNATSFLEDARSSASRRNTALSDMEEATPSTCVMALTLPVDAYAVVGPDATVAAAAALAAQDPALRCVVVAAAGMGATHVLDRKVRCQSMCCAVCVRVYRYVKKENESPPVCVYAFVLNKNKRNRSAMRVCVRVCVCVCVCVCVYIGWSCIRCQSVRGFAAGSPQAHVA